MPSAEKILPNYKPCVMHAIRVVAFAKFSVDILQKQMSTKALELVERWNVSKSEIQVGDRAAASIALPWVPSSRVCEDCV